VPRVRKRKNWSQSELAEAIEASRDIIGKYERNENSPSVEMAIKIAKAYKKKNGSQYKEFCEWLGTEDLVLSAFDIYDMNFRLKKVPRIFAGAYEYGLEPTKHSLDLLMRKYKV